MSSRDTPATFKAKVNLVLVPVVVRDSQGRPIGTLRQEDFQVFEDGKRQTIANFSVVDIPIERADRPLYSTEPIEPDVESNEKPFEGRIYVLVLDDLHVDALRSQNVKAAARQFIERRLGANDVMAVDARTGRVFWQYRYTPAPEAREEFKQWRAAKGR